MKSLFENYIRSISSKFSRVETSEMGYRTDFEILIKGIFQTIKVQQIDHDAKVANGNKPDFVVLKYDVPILYIEAKDIGISLDKVEKSDQMTRYYGYTNLVLTDYVEFRFYRNGIRYEEPIKIANYNIKNRTISSIPENYEHVVRSLVEFTQTHKEPIRSGEHLAKIMGGKAQRIRDNVRQFFTSESNKNSELIHIYETIRKLLVHDLTPDAFADMYSQTLVYGLFVARYYDESPDNFTRQEARDLVPDSNPFLGYFFDHIIGRDFDKRLEYIVNELCEVFSHSDIKELMGQYFKIDLFGKRHEEPDPVIHFYEDFLKEYDPELRKRMGAYYTPLPIVRFIVNSVDKILEEDFGLSRGLADTSKNTIGLHRVQILDPAVGTGTFISAVIRNIYERILKTKQEGSWPAYVHHDLLPRIHGFELMMAPYTIAHLKLGMAFEKTGFWKFHRRLGIYLTNSLEENPIQKELFAGFGFAESIAEESKEASNIKNKTPIMVIVGNPPYSGESSNAFYSGNDVYKVEPIGGKLKERNSKWLNDDYVKFIRFAESMVEKSGEGIVAMITAHGYLDNPTFRGMRWHLMKTFDEIYVFDLHGNANKKEISLDGGKDENVFNIKTGVALFFGIKRMHKKNDTAKIFRSDLYGNRAFKFDFLEHNSFDSIQWQEIVPSPSNYEWVFRDEEIKKEYQKGFSIEELSPIFSPGIVTSRDEMSIQYTKDGVEKVIRDFYESDVEELRTKYNLGKDVQDWKVEWAKKDIISNFSEEKIIPINYRPFDIRWTLYTGNSRGFHCRPRESVMNNFLQENIGLSVMRQAKDSSDYNHVLMVKNIQDGRMMYSGQGITSVFPLYIYLEDGAKVPNFKKEIIHKIENIVGKICSVDIFDYIYAVLYSPSYRKKYGEFLKIDFPRIPYPEDQTRFKKLVELGTELRLLHLFDSQMLEQFITTYPIIGSNTIDKIVYKDNKVFINENQYFGDMPESVWDFYIGGYKPAQKWLKDRKGYILTNADIEHYQKIIVALLETDKIMQKIDKILI